MRKSKAMRFATILMVVCLVATCTICGTLAKYVSKSDSTASASVAKWGVTADAINIENLFKVGDGTLVSTGKMAPGTSGSATFTLIGSGAPEVKYQVAGQANWNVAPTGDQKALEDHVLFTLTDSTGAKKIDSQTATEFNTAFGTLVNGTYVAGADFPLTGQYTLSWDWQFEGTGTDAEKAAYDLADTTLGNSDSLTNSFNIKLSVTQLNA